MWFTIAVCDRSLGYTIHVVSCAPAISHRGASFCHGNLNPKDLSVSHRRTGYRNDIPFTRTYYQCFATECSKNDAKLVELRRLKKDEGVEGAVIDPVANHAVTAKSLSLITLSAIVTLATLLLL
jgi:hypothetical protein